MDLGFGRRGVSEEEESELEEEESELGEEESALEEGESVLKEGAPESEVEYVGDEVNE